MSVVRIACFAALSLASASATACVGSPPSSEGEAEPSASTSSELSCSPNQEVGRWNMSTRSGGKWCGYLYLLANTCQRNGAGQNPMWAEGVVYGPNGNMKTYLLTNTNNDDVICTGTNDCWTNPVWGYPRFGDLNSFGSYINHYGTDDGWCQGFVDWN